MFGVPHPLAIPEKETQNMLDAVEGFYHILMCICHLPIVLSNIYHVLGHAKYWQGMV